VNARSSPAGSRSASGEGLPGLRSPPCRQNPPVQYARAPVSDGECRHAFFARQRRGCARVRCGMCRPKCCGAFYVAASRWNHEDTAAIHHTPVPGAVDSGRSCAYALAVARRGSHARLIEPNPARWQSQESVLRACACTSHVVGRRRSSACLVDGVFQNGARSGVLDVAARI